MNVGVPAGTEPSSSASQRHRLVVQVAVVRAGHGRVGEEEDRAGHVVPGVDRAGAAAVVAEQTLAVRVAHIVVAGADHDRQRGVEELRGGLVLGHLAVVGDVPGDQDRVDRSWQGVQVVHDPGGPLGRSGMAVEVCVTEMRDDQHDAP